MPRSLRIEYPNAFYHVMNRGKGRQMIFHSDKYYLDFLKTINEAYQRFDAVIHCYCLMGNHYHLLIETPNANISRVMRHINGVYTQRYNRLYSTDGPLFRGRFKAILVDSSSYLLQLSRYIHKNPSIFKAPLEKYRWSSYRNYLGLSKCPEWLNTERTLSMLDIGEDYQSFFSGKVDKEILEFYNKKKLNSILGSRAFMEKVLLDIQLQDKKDEIRYIQKEKLSILDIIKMVSNVFHVDIDLIKNFPSGKKHKNIARKFAMYLCQEKAGYSLNEIGEQFNISNINTVSKSICRIKKEIKEGCHQNECKKLKEVRWEKT